MTYILVKSGISCDNCTSELWQGSGQGEAVHDFGFEPVTQISSLARALRKRTNGILGRPGGRAEPACITTQCIRHDPVHS